MTMNPISSRPKLTGPRWMPARPKSHRQKMGSNVATEFKNRAWEFEEPLKYLGVDAAWVLIDLIGHQAFDVTAGEKTPATYYGRKFLYGIPFLLAGGLLSEHVVKGSNFVRALTIATTANSLMQVGYALSGLSSKFNLTVFLMHEAILLPLCFLLVQKPGMKGY